MNNLRLTILALLGYIFLVTAGCAPKTAETECNAIKEEAAKINAGVPSKVDFMTTLVGVSVTYSDGTCDIHVTSRIDEAKFFEVFVQVNFEVTPLQLDLLQTSQAIEYLNSEEGQNFYRDVARKALRDNPIIKTSHKDVRSTYVYIFDKGIINPLKLTINNQ